MIGVRECLGQDVPGSVPIKALNVDEHAHQLRDGHGRLSVVQLDGHFVRELGEIGANSIPNTELGRLVATNDILQGRWKVNGEPIWVKEGRHSLLEGWPPP